MPNKDKKINRQTYKRWYERHKEIAKERSRKQKEKHRLWFKEYKKQFKCETCGEKHPACLDFHHPREKTMNISSMVAQNMCKEKIIREISKCVPLCRNCHSKLHWSE